MDGVVGRPRDDRWPSGQPGPSSGLAATFSREVGEGSDRPAAVARGRSPRAFPQAFAPRLPMKTNSDTPMKLYDRELASRRTFPGLTPAAVWVESRSFMSVKRPVPGVAPTSRHS